MTIDAHQHFWRYDPQSYGWIDAAKASLKRDFLPGDLEPLLRAAGFDASIAVQASHTSEETEFLLSLADAHDFIAGVVGWVDLTAEDVEHRLAGLSMHAKLLGIRHIVQDETDDRFLLRTDFCRGVSCLEAFGLTFDVLIFPRHLQVAREFVSRFPAQRFVLDHLAKPDLRTGVIDAWARDLRALASDGRICAKLSGLVTEADWRQWREADIHRCLDVAFDAFGADRLMIGSDWPVCTLAASYERTLGVVTRYLQTRTAREREAVMGGTAERFWRLPR